jgi:hypothetical protein
LPEISGFQVFFGKNEEYFGKPGEMASFRKGIWRGTGLNWI